MGAPNARFRRSDPRIAERIHLALGDAQTLPLDDDAVDAAMACVTIHHRQPPEAGFAELRRVTRSRVVIFTFDLDGLPAGSRTTSPKD
jgi:ubiquinone/menaquinone biosynthesis C-methylase UbiE